VLLSNLGPTAKVDATPVAKPTAVKPVPLNITKVVAKSTNKTLTYGEFVDELSRVDMVFVGEQHDSVLHHQMQLQIIKSLYAVDENLGVGMEMFQRPFQSAVDRYFAGQISEAEFLKETEYAKRWGYDWQLYRAIVEYARRNDIPLAALNAPAELTKRVKEVGYDNLTDAERKELGPVDFNLKAHRDFWLELLSVMHGTHKATPEQKERSYQVMAIWDDYMAQSAANFKADRKIKRMVILAGGGHVDGGFGIPDRAAKYASATKATVRIVTGSETDDDPDALATDYVIYIEPPQAGK
jgi:uncharacterized iron-regulated protein